MSKNNDMQHSGVLLHKGNDWIIRYNSTGKKNAAALKEISLHPNPCLHVEFNLVHGERVTFKVIRYCTSHNCAIDSLSCSLDCAWDVVDYAQLVSIVEASKEVKLAQTWDDIFNAIENDIHVDIPIRLKNWLNNKFYPPIERKQI